jgi:hemolysin III
LESEQPPRSAKGEEIADRVVAARDAAGERMTAAREATAERMTAARDATADRVTAAKEATAETFTAAKEAAEEAVAKIKPRLRGVSHKYAFYVSLVLGIVLVSLADGGQPQIAAAIYAGSLSALLGVSALYHRVDWKLPSRRMWMRRLDHSMIFVLIAGTVTPFALLVMEGPFAKALLIAVWSAAIVGTLVELIWLSAPKWVHAIVYLAAGAVGAVGFPAIVIETGLIAGILIATGGALYAAGAIIYAVQRPNPSPAVFGYHEIFHALVLVAAAAHFAAVAFFALPAG